MPNSQIAIKLRTRTISAVNHKCILLKKKHSLFLLIICDFLFCCVHNCTSTYPIPGANVNAQTEETQETALTLACCGGFLDCTELLVTFNADLELGCSTPLMEAAQEGHLELVNYLIRAGKIYFVTNNFTS